MQYLRIKKGSTSVILPVSIFDSSSTTGAKLAGLVYNSAGLTAYYNRTGAAGAATAITNAPSDSSGVTTLLTRASEVRLAELDAANLPTDVAAVKADTAAVKVQTDKLAFTVANKVDANVLVLNGDATAAANLAKSASVIFRGSVTGAATTTTLIDSTLTQAAADHWKGRIVIFTSGALKYQATDITAFDPITDKLTFTALTGAPSALDEYVIV